tara:strand:+ start:461 stop:646 length:186 start_codon:yes stop_codon:yes gene_type:complete
MSSFDFDCGLDKAQADMRQPDFNLLTAICSFDGDPADTSFQRGYLHALVSANEKANERVAA